MIGLKTTLWWLGLSLDYIVAGGLIVASIYVTLYWQNRFTRLVGMGLLLAGGVIGGVAYGKTGAAAHVYAEWRAANTRAEQEKKQRDLDIARDVRQSVEQQIKELRDQRDDLKKQVADYANYVAKNSKDKCRIATPDDIRRLCAIGAGKDCKGHPR